MKLIFIRNMFGDVMADAERMRLITAMLKELWTDLRNLLITGLLAIVESVEVSSLRFKALVNKPIIRIRNRQP